MKNRTFICALALTLLAGGVHGVWAQAKAPEKAKKEVKQEVKKEAAKEVKKELVEKSGVIQIIKADAAKQEKYDTILLKAGDETIKLLPGKDKKLFKPLEKLDGKTVAVKGEFLPPNPPKYPLAAMKVASFTEVKAPAQK